MCQHLLSDASLYCFLFEIDQDLAKKTKAARCRFCGAALHVANYRRKPRGAQAEQLINCRRRFSFTCYKCQLRTTPPSVRFLGRKVYLGVVVIILTAMRQGLSPRGEKTLRQSLGVDRKTVAEWQKWWVESFQPSDFGQEARRQLFSSISVDAEPPLSILKALSAIDSMENFCQALRFLSPASAVFAISVHARLWPC